MKARPSGWWRSRDLPLSSPARCRGLAPYDRYLTLVCLAVAAVFAVSFVLRLYRAPKGSARALNIGAIIDLLAAAPVPLALLSRRASRHGPPSRNLLVAEAHPFQSRPRAAGARAVERTAAAGQRGDGVHRRSPVRGDCRLPCGARRPAGILRQHPGGAVVGGDDDHHHRLRRQGADLACGPPAGRRGDGLRHRPLRAVGRHPGERLRAGTAPQGFPAELEPRRAASALPQPRRAGAFGDHAAA